MIEGPIFQPERIAAKLAMVGDRRSAELSAQFEKQPRLTPETAAEYADYLRPGPNRKKLYVLPSGDVTPQPTAPSIRSRSPTCPVWRRWTRPPSA